MITRMAHICIATGDLAASERFYCAGLGLEKLFVFVSEGTAIGMYLRVAEMSFIEIFKGDVTDGKAGSPIRHMCLETNDIDALRTRMTGMGYQITEKDLGADHSWQAWTTDPSGVRIEFHQYTEESCQLTLRDCILT